METTIQLSAHESLATQASRILQTMELDVDSPMAPNTPARTSSDSTRLTPINDLISEPFGDIDIQNDPDKGLTFGAPMTETTDSPSILVENAFHDDDDESDLVLPFGKRKRTSIDGSPTDIDYDMLERDSSHDEQEPVIKKYKKEPKVRGVIIGVWRDSDQLNDADKHVIYGFIDVHDRLRTRIYALNRRGEELQANIPVGAGGCWVTFPRIIFDSHLESLNALEVKEYVKLRSEAMPEKTREEAREADLQAALKAKVIVAEAEPPVTLVTKVPGRIGRPPNSARHSLPRQPVNKTPSFQAVNAGAIQTPKASPSSEGKAPGVLLGYWADSTELVDVDKHAVFGVIGGSDCFRVKVQRITRDGRYVDGNFPVGAGALWLHYDRVVLEPHLVPLSRPEVKEYTRIRQKYINGQELEKDRKAGEAKAVKDAKAIVAAQAANPPINGAVIHKVADYQANNQTSVRVSNQGSPNMESRQNSRSELRSSARQQAEVASAAAAVAAAEKSAEKLRRDKAAAKELQYEKTRKEVSMAEAEVHEAAHMELKHNIKKLNKVWMAQQAVTSGGGTVNGESPQRETKFYNGIKYERKQNGPFEGKLVSNPQIMSIDGEDYVEYRVLTKPSFC